MRRLWLAAVACATAMGTSGSAQGPSSDTTKPFNGTSLGGLAYRRIGAVARRGGEARGVGRLGTGSLVLDKSHQDIILRFAFRCEGCDAGVLLRNAAQSSKPGTTTALYVGLSGADARTLHRVTLDAQSKEVERTNLCKWTARQNPPGMQMRMTPGANGWTNVHIQVRGDVTAPRLRADAAVSRRRSARRRRIRRRRIRCTARSRCASPAAKCASRTSR